MRVSLRVRVLVVVAGINAALFVVGGVYLRDRFRSADRRVVEALVGQMDGVGYAVSGNIRAEGELNVARILEWPGWGLVADAILVDANLDVLPDGRIAPRGIDLNPRGAAGRGPGFDRQVILRSLSEAMDRVTPVAVAGGRAVPVRIPGGARDDVWGGCWLRIESALDLRGIFQGVLPLFTVSTLVLTLGTFGVLRWLVVEPVSQLAAGARRVQAGDFSTRLAEPRRDDELAELVKSFNAMTETVRTFNERLEEEVQKATAQARRAEAEAMTQRRLAAMGELAAGIAHEINNPLGGLLNAVERLSRADLAPKKRAQYLALLHSGLERIGDTVGRLLRFTPRQAARGPVDLCELAREALALVAHRAQREGVAMELSIAGAAVEPGGPAPAVRPLEGEQHELGQALLNLLVNALDALAERPPGDAPPRVRVSIEELPDAVTIAVEDNGPGIPEGQLEEVLDLFYTTKEVGAGSGLGLSIVHNVVSSHGGRLRLLPVQPHGLRAEISLPTTAA